MPLENIFQELKKRWFAVVSLLILAAGSVLYFYVDQGAISFITFIVGFAGLLFSVYQYYQGNKAKTDYEKAVTEYKQKYESELQKSEKLEKEKSEATFEKSELRKFLDKINEMLQRENITKEELIAKLDAPLPTIIIQKYNEPKKRIQKKLLSLGFKTFGYGIYVLPPVKADFIQVGFDLKSWIKRNVLKGLPKDYKYIINFAIVVDLRKMVCDKKIVTKARTFLDILKAEDIMKPQEVVEYIKLKKNISTKDIIELPNLLFLVEDYLIKKSDLEKLRKNNDAIFEGIMKKVSCQSIKTTDLAAIGEKELTGILSEHISEPDKIAKRIIENAKFWKAYFEQRI
jgi:hypothetical protein